MSEKKEAKKAKKAEKKAAKAAKSGKGKGFRVFIAILLVLAIVGEFYIGLTIPGKIEDAITAATAAPADGNSETAGITFAEGTYGGVEFKTLEDVVKYYNDAYNKTKAKTADYKNSEGAVETLYAFIGEEKLQIKEGSLLVDGSANKIVNGVVPGVLKQLFKANICPLPPQANRHPADDVDSAGVSMATSRVVLEDVQTGKVEEKDGKIVITLVPVATEMSEKGMDPQGHFFNSLGALDSVVASIDILSFSQGGASENVKATYEGGKAVVTIDPASGEIVEADYNMVVNVDVQHANLSAIKDKSASLTILYDNHFPVSEETWAEKGYTPV